MEINDSTVLKTIIEVCIDWHSEGVANTGWIAICMDTTPYKVRKHIKNLLADGYIKKATRGGGWCEESMEPSPPLQGYSLTDKAKSTDIYIQVEKEFEIALKKSFGIK